MSTAQAFHPVRDRLNSLVWDGVPRVRVALHHFLGAEVNDTNEKYLRTFMLGAVNRVFHPGCKFELMLVLVGGQGAGKTTFIRFLALDTAAIIPGRACSPVQPTAWISCRWTEAAIGAFSR